MASKSGYYFTDYSKFTGTCGAEEWIAKSKTHLAYFGF